MSSHMQRRKSRPTAFEIEAYLQQGLYDLQEIFLALGVDLYA